MGATDFGFAIEEGEDTDSDVSVAGGVGQHESGTVGAPAVVAAVDMIAPDSPAAPGNVPVVSPALGSTTQGQRNSYEDRNAGLSMQERLANLEFSDDDDDDDDPLGL